MDIGFESLLASSALVYFIGIKFIMPFIKNNTNKYDDKVGIISLIFLLSLLLIIVLSNPIQFLINKLVLILK